MISPILNVICSNASRRTYKVSGIQKYYLESMKECRTTRYGGRVVQCENCGQTRTIYNPCNKRGCPICSGHRQKRWKEKVSESVLNTDHYHVIFSIPDIFTMVWLRHKKKFMNAFFECIKQAIAKLSKEYGITPGCVASFQSHGQGMVYKPHIHCALTNGGLVGFNKWEKLGSFSYTMLSDVVKETLYKKLKKVIPVEDLPEESEIEPKGYRVYATYFEYGAEKIIGYLAHSASGIVINVKKGIVINHEKHTVLFYESRNGEYKQTELDTDLFVERYINHIPPPRTVTIRYYGLYSNQFSSQFNEISNLFPEIEIKEAKQDICQECKNPMKIIKILEPYEEAYPVHVACAIRPPG